jgi:hypothetical protein
MSMMIHLQRVSCFVLFLCVVGCSTNKVVPQQTESTDWQAMDVFPILPWELPPRTKEFGDARHGLSSLADAGYTVAAFVRPEHLKECERLGLRAIVCPAVGIRKWREMSDSEIESAVRSLIDEAGHSRAILGYFLMDEPGVRDFPALTKAVAAVKRLAPGKLAYINLYPDYATLGAPDLSQLGTSSYTDYLERFVREVRPQMISYDNYRVQFSNDLKDAAVAASYFDNLLTARRVAAEHGLPFWNIACSNRIRPVTPIPSPANLLLQSYTTLAAGGRGLTWYTYYAGGYTYAPVDNTGNRTAIWSYVRMTNEQVKVLGRFMRPLTSTGVYFTTPAPFDNAPALPGKLIDAVHSATPVMIGEFSGPADETYAMVVNLSLERSSRVTITPAAGRAIAGQISPVDAGLSPIEKDGSLWLTAGQGALLKLSQIRPLP